jgi:hypothetical protein
MNEQTNERSPKYNFYEKVWVVSCAPGTRTVEGELAAVLGRVPDERGNWFYGIHVYSTGEGWDVAEYELQSTGEFDRRETFYADTSLRVRVDEQGRGSVAQPDTVAA